MGKIEPREHDRAESEYSNAAEICDFGFLLILLCTVIVKGVLETSELIPAAWRFTGSCKQGYKSSNTLLITPLIATHEPPSVAGQSPIQDSERPRDADKKSQWSSIASCFLFGFLFTWAMFTGSPSKGP